MQFLGNFLGFTRLTEKKQKLNTHFAYSSISFLFVLFFSFGIQAQNTPVSKGTGTELLAIAIQNLLDLKTIESNIRLETMVDGETFSARGRYEEQLLSQAKTNPFQRSMYRLDLNFLMDAPSKPGSEPNRLTIVYHPSEDREKDRIWKYTSIEGVKRVSFVRIAPMKDAIKQSQHPFEMGSVGEIRNLGGIVAMIRQIARTYDFPTSPQSAKLEEVDSKGTWKLIGTMKKSELERLIPVFGDLGKRKTYPSQLPSDIEIYIGKEDSFPYKIVYMNRPREESANRTILSRMIYHDVVLDGEEIPEFKFSTFERGELPEGVFRFDDDTVLFIESLKLR